MADMRLAPSPIPAGFTRQSRIVRRKPRTLGILLLGHILTTPILAAFAGVIAFAMLEPILAFLVPAQPAHIQRLWVDWQPHRGMTYHVEYRFERSGFIGREILSQDEYQHLQAGQIVGAHVLRIGSIGYSLFDRPPRAYAHARMVLWFGSFFAAAIGSVLGYAIWYLPWRERLLVHTGQATFGAVVAKSIHYHGRRHLSFTLTYQYKVNGQLIARRISINPNRFDSAEIRDLVIILFDPMRPQRSIVYDYCNFRVI